MATDLPQTAMQLQSLVTPGGDVEVALVSVPVRSPGRDEVVVRMLAAPLNPTDIMLMFGPADISTATSTGDSTRPALTVRIPTGASAFIAGRSGQALPVGREGAGIVVEGGASPGAQALVGKTVALLGSGMLSQYQTVAVEQCLLLPKDATPADGASCFINPLTTLGMLETMRAEGHVALVHTAAASNLGQMLNRACQRDGVGLVNVVRRPDQVSLLKSLGAVHVCDSSAPDFEDQLTEAIAAVGATIAFDATGGGPLAGNILNSMEAALARAQIAGDSAFGASKHKQVYQYGRLDTNATTYSNNFGLDWSLGGWMVFNFLQGIGPARTAELKERIARELRTTFVSHYSRTISLEELLDPEIIPAYYRRGTNQKFLVDLSRG